MRSPVEGATCCAAHPRLGGDNHAEGAPRDFGARNYRSRQTSRFLHPAGIGDAMAASVAVAAKQVGKASITLDCLRINQNGQIVLSGVAEMRAARGEN